MFSIGPVCHYPSLTNTPCGTNPYHRSLQQSMLPSNHIMDLLDLASRNCHDGTHQVDGVTLLVSNQCTLNIVDQICQSLSSPAMLTQPFAPPVPSSTPCHMPSPLEFNPITVVNNSSDDVKSTAIMFDTLDCQCPLMALYTPSRHHLPATT